MSMDAKSKEFTTVGSDKASGTLTYEDFRAQFFGWSLAALFLGALGVFGLELFLWLQRGEWVRIPVGMVLVIGNTDRLPSIDVTCTMLSLPNGLMLWLKAVGVSVPFLNWLQTPTSWIGLSKLVLWWLHSPLSWTLSAIASLLAWWAANQNS